MKRITDYLTQKLAKDGLVLTVAEIGCAIWIFTWFMRDAFKP